MKRMLPFAILAGCLVVGVLPALAANQSVTIRDFSFTPRNVAVLPGESVSWQADSTGFPHNVHLDGETDPIDPQSSNFSGTRQFPTEGEFRYHCDVHPTQMRGTVFVNQTGTVPTPSPTPSPTRLRPRRPRRRRAAEAAARRRAAAARPRRRSRPQRR